MVSNSAKLDSRTKQHTEFEVAASNGSRDMGRTKVAEKKIKKRKKEKMNIDNPIQHPLRGSLIKTKTKTLELSLVLLLAIPVGDAIWFCPCSFFSFFFLFFTPLLSGPYLSNRYSQGLQIECAAWSYGLILDYSLSSNSLRFFFFFFFRHDFVRVISLEPLLAETPN